MKSGGYKVIDLKNIPLSNFAVNIPGIYEQIEASNKLCVVSGLYAGGIEYDDCAVLFTGGSTFTAKVTDTLSLSVRDNDNVTVNVLSPVSAMEYIDGSAYTIGPNGVVTDPNLSIKLANLIAKKEPFYFKDLDLSRIESVSGTGEEEWLSHITCVPCISSFDVALGGVIYAGSSAHTYSFNFTVNSFNGTVKFTLITEMKGRN